ncbi:immunoglobulin superfamily member 10-like [Branchiostoma floridae]|uniref:Immunoglobulin superfamily member 10-like n=2 Tax=Branchiostoma floridae TaxID=7739 RepID=A0A9J7LFK4_BRAFL|nr:immunoglobulin superfamily member 10-like [Branchiostoma floridae]
MANKRKTLLVLLLIVLREAGPTAACSSSCPSDCDCYYKRLRSVPQDLPANITRLDLDLNSIKRLSQSDFSKYTKLRELNITRNPISIVNEQTFSNLTELEKLDLSANKFTYIQPSTFSGLSQLKELKLFIGEVSKIDPGTFSNLPKLRMLDLHTNLIADIKAGTFSDLPELTILLLSANKIRDIQLGAFSNLPRLDQINLNQNLLTTIHPGTFSDLPKLTSLGLDKNPWHCDCRIANFTKTITAQHPNIPTSTFEKQAIKNQIICETPSDHHGKPFGNINPVDLICKKTPKIVIFENSKGDRLVQGGTLHLVCEASGTPVPDITVTLPSGLNATVESGGRVTVGVNGTITIRDVTAADAGQYICTATNPVGSTSDKLFVEVETPTSVMPVVSTGSVSAGLVETTDAMALTSVAQSDSMMFKKPTIVRFKTSDNTLAQGEALYLVCEASGIPLPNILVTLPSGLIASAESGGRVTVEVNAPSIDPSTDDMVNKSLNTSGGQGRSLNPEITSSDAGTNEQADMPENAYEDPESLLATAGSLRSDVVANEKADIPENVYDVPKSVIAIVSRDGRDVGSKEESVCASKAASAQKPMTVHELVNIVYGKGESGHDYEDMKPISMHKKEAEADTSHYIGPDGHEKASAATSHSSYENKETVRDTSHVTCENTEKEEAIPYYSAQIHYQSKDDEAESAASQSDRAKPESPAIIYEKDESSAS